MIYDHAPYYFACKMTTLPRKSSLHCNVEAIAKGYHTYQSVWVAVGDKLSCQRELRRSICSYCDKRRVDRGVGHFPKKNSTVCLVLLRQSRVSFVSLDTTLYGNALSFLNLSGKNFQRRNFCGTNFRDLVFNRENLCLAKISRYTVIS